MKHPNAISQALASYKPDRDYVAELNAMNWRFMEAFAHDAALAYALERASRVPAWTRVFRGGGE